MRQHAWLDFHGGCWHLVASGDHDPDRKWQNRDSALSDLAWEGWIIDGPNGEQPTMRHSDNRHVYGYALRRTIH